MVIDLAYLIEFGLPAQGERTNEKRNFSIDAKT